MNLHLKTLKIVQKPDPIHLKWYANRKEFDEVRILSVEEDGPLVLKGLTWD